MTVDKLLTNMVPGGVGVSSGASPGRLEICRGAQALLTQRLVEIVTKRSLARDNWPRHGQVCLVG
jgi:hypothetical protein